MILDGAKVAAKRRRDLAKKTNQPLGLGIVVATAHAPTRRYVQLKKAAAETVGYRVFIKDLGDGATTEQLLAACQEYNANADITGYIVQLPLPSQVDPKAIFAAIDPAKDADGLTEANRRLIGTSEERVMPAPAKAVLGLLAAYHIAVMGKKVTVIGKSWSAGRPIAEVCRHQGARVTSCDSKTSNLSVQTRKADIVISVAGAAHLITADMVNADTIVIDLGANNEGGKLVGDVDFAPVAGKVKAISPVPGGVGPMTVVSLLENVYTLSKIKNE